ncbi:MAG TPA: ABC transporter ATP-binding protein [Polyangia bacterium]|nr:ABC transporter ATP-binding protein [Polyangia bacterium]
MNGAAEAESAPPLIQVQALSRRFRVGAPGLFPRLRARLRGPATAPTTAPTSAPARPPTTPGSWLHAVDDVTFAIKRGESVGLVGESGCGKSTLARLLTGLITPTGGQILFDGRDLGELHRRNQPERFRIQQVFQDPTDSLNPRFSAFDAIADPLKRIQGLRGAALKARVRALAEQVALPAPLLGRLPHQLSGGQKARVGIARAIAVSPSLLVLDEPTSALDVSVQAVILQLLDELRARLGMTYLFVTHDLSVVKLLCNRVIVMYLGRVVEEGPVDAVFRRPAHPYTKGLLSAIPSADGRDESSRVRLDGEPRSPIDPDPRVCCLDGRCPSATDRCRQERPVLRTIGTDQRAACHFA